MNASLKDKMELVQFNELLYTRYSENLFGIYGHDLELLFWEYLGVIKKKKKTEYKFHFTKQLIIKRF